MTEDGLRVLLKMNFLLTAFYGFFLLACNRSAAFVVDSGPCTWTSQCRPGYRLVTCEYEEINECDPNPCANGSCASHPNGYTCTCYEGWKGKNCDKLGGMLFCGIPGTGTPTAEAWAKAGPGTTDDPACRSVADPFRCLKHYRNPLIDEWATLYPQQVRYSVYKEGVEVAWVLFNATGSNSTNWFNSSRVIASSYTDLTSSAPYNTFAIDDPWPTLSAVHRHFYINKDFGGCDNDNTWLGTFDGTGNCFFDQYGNWPYILYSKLSTSANTGNISDFGFGDCAVVTLVS